MAIIRNSSSVPNRIRKKDVPNPTVISTRQPSSLREMGDTDFGTLDENVDGFYVTYDNVDSKFKLVDADEILRLAALDGDLSDEFIDQVEAEYVAPIDGPVDGGTF